MDYSQTGVWNGIKAETHEADVCVVGGGMAGICAAVSAARHGAKVVLMQERPVLGGNASSETRVHICGADRWGSIPNMRETGILEEIRLENVRINSNYNFSVWDTVLYEKVRFQPGLNLMLNCSCQSVEMDGNRIVSVTGWQLSTQTFQKVKSAIFIDCSGDGILAPLTGADFRMGREGRNEYGESIAPEKADAHTMGMTCLFQARKYDAPQHFEKPSWAYTFKTDDEIPHGDYHAAWYTMGYWWVELGGAHHSIHDTEYLTGELLKIALGMWDHIKNQADHGADNWALDWLQYLPAKRESRRYIGDHILTQLDVASGGKFDDTVAYGGWSMDDHHPDGFWAVKIGAPATIFHPSPSPFGIPYGAHYSRNIANLMFAGRCGSCTHAAMSSTRVMGTGCSMGQACGTAAALAVQRGLTPRQVGERHIRELQQLLMRDDCYIPRFACDPGTITKSAQISASRGNPESVRDGTHRPVGDDAHSWECNPGDWIAYNFRAPLDAREVTLVLDSMLEGVIQMSYHQAESGEIKTIPARLPKAFHIDGLVGGKWERVGEVAGNYQRLVRVPIAKCVEGIRLTIDATWGGGPTKLFAFYVD